MKLSSRTLRLLVCALVPLLLVACMPALRRPEPPANTASTLGLNLIGVQLSSGGYMLDFRYIVEDPAQAAPMIDRALIPYLIHESSGARFAVPSPAKVGPLRQMPRQLEAGKQYFILFANPGQYVKVGDLVTVVIGEYRFEHLAVD